MADTMTKAEADEKKAIAQAHALINGKGGQDLLAKVRELQAAGIRGGQFDRTMGNIANVLTGAGMFLAAVAPPEPPAD